MEAAGRNVVVYCRLGDEAVSGGVVDLCGALRVFTVRERLATAAGASCTRLDICPRRPPLSHLCLPAEADALLLSRLCMTRLKAAFSQGRLGRTLIHIYIQSTCPIYIC